MKSPEPSAPEVILVVDDVPTNVVLLEKSLGRAGYRILTADNGFDAVDVARERKPDLILLDIMMPNRDGLEVCRILHEDPVTAGIPVLFVTARTETDQVVAALGAGGCDYVTKPFILNELLARVRVHLRLRQAEKELARRHEELAELSQKLAEMNIELAYLTRTDPLTGLLNRRAWQEAAGLEEARCRLPGLLFGIVMLDVDEFKLLNDTFGHHQGDEALRQIAEGIRRAVDPMHLVGRYGGEEFVVLAPGADLSATTEIAERIRAGVESLKVPAPRGAVVTLSAGVASGSKAWEELVRRADRAMYQAKRGGRNRVHVDEPEPVPATA